MIGRICAALALALLLAVPVAAQRSKVINDPDEYNAYTAAVNLADPAQKAAALEAFIAKYPASVAKEDALLQALVAYQDANDHAGIEKSARRILQLDKDNVRALAIVVFVDRVHAGQGDKAALAALGPGAQRGLTALGHWQRPEGIAEDQYQDLRRQMAVIFNGAAGFAALQAKDYGKARGFYRKAVADDPDDMLNVYQLGVADLEMTPLDRDGFWYVARAVNLAGARNDAEAVTNVDRYGRAKYKRYHGSEEGWDAIVARAARGTAVPADFGRGIKPAS
jgi:tetratricopeptide (TPR) repeat protein